MEIYNLTKKTIGVMITAVMLTSCGQESTSSKGSARTLGTAINQNGVLQAEQVAAVQGLGVDVYDIQIPANASGGNLNVQTTMVMSDGRGNVYGTYNVTTTHALRSAGYSDANVQQYTIDSSGKVSQLLGVQAKVEATCWDINCSYYMVLLTILKNGSPVIQEGVRFVRSNTALNRYQKTANSSYDFNYWVNSLLQAQ